MCVCVCVCVCVCGVGVGVSALEEHFPHSYNNSYEMQLGIVFKFDMDQGNLLLILLVSIYLNLFYTSTMLGRNVYIFSLKADQLYS